MNEPFSLAFLRPCAFGTLAAVNLPAGFEAVPERVLAQLHAQERLWAEALKGRRQIEFAGGRLAWRRLRPEGGALGSGERGEPLAPPGVCVSVTHKNELVVVVVGDAAAGTLGLDLEGDGRERLAIAERVLTAAELRAVEALPEGARWEAVQLRFAIKEATYKAIHPHLRRFVGFQEAEVTLGESPEVRVFTRQGEPELALECCWESLPGSRILALVRARLR